MKAETADYLVKARATLADAQKIAASPLPHVTAREAYLAAFHAAEAYTFAQSGKVAKTRYYGAAATRNLRVAAGVKLFSAGKLCRLILDALCKGECPMTTLEIVAAVVADLNFGEDAAKAMQSRVRSSLLYLWKVRGLVVKEGLREAATWRLADE